MLFVPRMAASIPDHVRGVTVRASVLADVYALAANLREGDRDEVESLGMDVRVGIRNSFRHAVLRKTYLVDGEVAAMSGLCGSMLGDIGEPYLMTGPAAERVPLAFVKHAKASVAEMIHLKRRLEGHVAANYTKACRLLEVLGFALGEPLPVGPKAALFRKYTMTRVF
jgi:hypothetical protein